MAHEETILEDEETEQEEEGEKDRLQDENVLSLLLKYGADINAQDVYGLTPLHVAAQKGNISALYILLQNPNLDLEV